jgi:CDP-diacylglycerol---glycerol-3-phosphate 3-phosphatidyltransferase
MSLADQLTLIRIAAVPVVVVLFVWDFDGHYWWATAVFIAAMTTDWFDGRVARWRGRTSPLGSLLDPVADKVLVLTTLIMLVEAGVCPGWMVAAIVARELLVSGLRLAAIERGVVMAARDLGKLKTWSQATAAAIGGFAAAGAWADTVAWWALLVAVVLTWVSGLDYARIAPGARKACRALRPLVAEVLANTGLTPAAAIRSRDAVPRQQRLNRRQHGVAIVGLWRDADLHGAAA